MESGLKVVLLFPTIPTFLSSSYFFPTFSKKVPTIPTFLPSNAKMMIGLRKSRESAR